MAVFDYRKVKSPDLTLPAPRPPGSRADTPELWSTGCAGSRRVGWALVSGIEEATQKMKTETISGL